MIAGLLGSQCVDAAVRRVEKWDLEIFANNIKFGDLDIWALARHGMIWKFHVTIILLNIIAIH